MNIIEAFEDPKIFGSLIKDKVTFINWKVCLKSIFRLPLSEKEVKIYHKFTGRNKPPKEPFKEIFLIIGRRGGKSFISALIAVYLAVFKEWQLGIERGHIMCIASDRKQAGVVFSYVKEILQLPAFKNMVLSETKEDIQLSNKMTISIHTCSYRSLRGYGICACICDEIAYWRVEGSNPAAEVLRALRPAMANISHSLMISISTSFSRSGPLWENFRDRFGKDDERILVWRAGTLDMNPCYSKQEIEKALKDDYVSARSEYFSEFRKDLESYISREALDSVIVPGRYELERIDGVSYYGFVDPSGGRGDAMTLSICHKEKSGKIVQDCIRVKKPPFNPRECVEEFSTVVKCYKLNSVRGDKYSGSWCSSAFKDVGINYKNMDLSKSEIYLEFLPLVMQQRIELLDHKQQTIELMQLERRSGRGKDFVDHPRGLHDDLANSCAGAFVMASKPRKRAGMIFSKHDVYPDDNDPCDFIEWMRNAHKDRPKIKKLKGKKKLIISTDNLHKFKKMENKK